MMTRVTDRRVNALSQALVLAIVADTDEQTARAVALAERISNSLTPEDVETAKQRALEVVFEMAADGLTDDSPLNDEEQTA